MCVAYIMENIPPLLNNQLPKEDMEESERRRQLVTSDMLIKNFNIIASRIQDRLDGKETNQKNIPVVNNNIIDNNVSSSQRTKFHSSSYFNNIKKHGGVSQSTVYRWMRSIGFNWRSATCSFYTDNHEHPDVVKYRKQFVHRYLHQYEPYMLRWLQIKEEDILSLLSDSKIKIKDEVVKSGKIKLENKEMEMMSYLNTVSCTFNYDDGTKWENFISILFMEMIFCILY